MIRNMCPGPPPGEIECCPPHAHCSLSLHVYYNCHRVSCQKSLSRGQIVLFPTLSLSLSLFREGNANEEERYKITAFAVAGEKTTGPLNWKGSHFGSFVAEAKVNLGKYRKAGQDRTSLIHPVFLKLFVVDILGLIRRWAEPAAGHRGVENPPPPPRLHILIMRLSMTQMNSDGSRHFGNGPSL